MRSYKNNLPAQCTAASPSGVSSITTHLWDIIIIIMSHSHVSGRIGDRVYDYKVDFPNIRVPPEPSISTWWSNLFSTPLERHADSYLRSLVRRDALHPREQPSRVIRLPGQTQDFRVLPVRALVQRQQEMAYGRRFKRRRKARKYRKKYGYRGRKKYRRVIKKYKRRRYAKSKKSLKRQRFSVGRIPRDWPPTRLIANFENYSEYDPQGGFVNNVANLNFGALQLGTRVNMAGCAHFTSADAAGTRTAFTAQNPRNWTTISPLYNRAEILSTTFKVRFTNTASSNGFYICAWISDDLDLGNPFQDLSLDTGVAAPWAAVTAANQNTMVRNILLRSRRVKRRIILGGGVGTGKGTMNLKFTINQLRNRIGQKVLHGYKARDVASTISGLSHGMDFTVANALTQNQGVDNKINIVWFPTDHSVTTKFTNVQVQQFSRVLFYDRVHD